MPEARGQRIAVALAVAGVVVVAVQVWPRGATIAPPGGSAAVEADRRGERAASPAPDAAAPAAPAVSREEQAAAVVHGVLFDAGGAPLADWPVQLTRSGRDPVECTSTADGAFAFGGVEPGRCRVFPFDAEAVRCELDLANGDDRGIELRLPVGSCAFTGRVTVNGGPAYRVRLRADLADGATRGMVPGAGGVVRQLLPAGEHVLRAIAERDVVFDEWPLAIGARTATLRWVLSVSTPRLVADVDDGGGEAIEAFELVATGSTLFGETRTLRSHPIPGRRAALDLPPGRWSVTAQSPSLQTMPPQELEIARGQRRAELHFRGQRAAKVELALRRADGRAFRPVLPAAWLPCLDALWNGEHTTPCVELERTSGFGGPAKLGLVSVPLGAGRLQWSDGVVDGQWSFLPFAPVPPLAVHVQAGAPNVATVVVEPRARVELVACERGGRELLQGALRVFAGEREVRSRPTPRATRFESFLPAGPYRAVIEHPGGTVEHRVDVCASDLQLRVRL